MSNMRSRCISLLVLGLVSLLGLVEGLNVSFGVLLPNHTVSATIDTCPCLMSVQAEADLVMKSMQNFTWTERTLDDPVSLQINYHDTQCSDVHGPIIAMDLFYRNMVNILYGPCCKYALSPVGRYSKHWGLPIITPGGLAGEFSNRTNFPLVTRFTATYKKMSDFFATYLIEPYNWTHLSFIYHENLQERNVHGFSHCSKLVEALRNVLDPLQNISSEALQNGLNLEQNIFWSSSDPQSSMREGRAKSYTFNMEPFDEHNFKRINWNDILNGVQNNSRVVVLCASPEWVREIMLMAADKNFDNGEYVFFNIDLFGNQLERPWYRANDTDEKNEKARRIYDYLMTVTLRKPDSLKYQQFSEEVKRRARQQYGDSIYGNEEMNSFVGAFHDAVILYSLALNETLAAGDDPKNGTEITRRMWNRTFEGIRGTVSIDEFGNRNADFCLLDMNETGHFEVVAYYYGNKRKFEEVPGKRILWGGDRTTPPPNTPQCGFDGLGCRHPEPYFIIIIVLCLLLVIVSSVAFFVYRAPLQRRQGSRQVSSSVSPLPTPTTYQCMMCLTADSDMTFYPCGHKVICMECSRRMKTCFSCHENIQEKVRCRVEPLLRPLKDPVSNDTPSPEAEAEAKSPLIESAERGFETSSFSMTTAAARSASNH